MEPVAVGVEFVFDEIFVDFYAKFFGEGAGFVPGGALHFETGETGIKIMVAKEGVAEFVEQEKLKMSRFFNIENGGRGMEGKFFSGFENKFGVGGFNFFQEAWHRDCNRN